MLFGFALVTLEIYIANCTAYPIEAAFALFPSERRVRSHVIRMMSSNIDRGSMERMNRN